MRTSTALERENAVVLNLVDALLGLVSPSIRAVSVNVSTDRAIVYFAVGDRIDQDIEEILFELEAALGSAFESKPLAVAAEVHVGNPNEDWPGRGHRMVYLAKD
jgi:hypothetical protein